MAFDALGNPVGTVYPLIGNTQPLPLVADPVADSLNNKVGTFYDGAIGAGMLQQDLGPVGETGFPILKTPTSGLGAVLPAGYSFLTVNVQEISLGDAIEIGLGAGMEIT